MYYTYVLQSQQDKNFYIGSTNDLKRRYTEHQQGNVTSTKNRRPFQLIYYEAHLAKKDAQRRERYYKTTKGKTVLNQILRNSLKSV